LIKRIKVFSFFKLFFKEKGLIRSKKDKELIKLKQDINQIRKLIIDSVFKAGSGHPGGSLSAVELVYTLFDKFLKFDPDNPKWEDRDYFILSKGHAAPLLYTVLAYKKFFEIEELATLRKIGSRLQGHPDALKVPGVEVSTGSLGQGFGVAGGIALGLKISGKKNKVYALLGDGEIQEGSVWETAMACAHYKLSNICAIIDVNKFQIDGRVDDVMRVEPIDKKFEAFGWRSIRINGHDIKQVEDAYKWFLEYKGDKPSVIVADTVKGKGVSFMENKSEWHGKAPNENEYKAAKNEISKE